MYYDRVSCSRSGQNTSSESTPRHLAPSLASSHRQHGHQRPRQEMVETQVRVKTASRRQPIVKL